MLGVPTREASLYPKTKTIQTISVNPTVESIAETPLTIGSHTLHSRLIVGTGKYASYELMAEALERSGPTALPLRCAGSG